MWWTCRTFPATPWAANKQEISINKGNEAPAVTSESQRRRVASLVNVIEELARVGVYPGISWAGGSSRLTAAIGKDEKACSARHRVRHVPKA